MSAFHSILIACLVASIFVLWLHTFGQRLNHPRRKLLQRVVWAVYLFARWCRSIAIGMDRGVLAYYRSQEVGIHPINERVYPPRTENRKESEHNSLSEGLDVRKPLEGL